MDDPAKFASVTEYHILMWSVGLLILTECIFLILTSRGNKSPRKKSDRGTVWLISIAWCCSIMAGAYFRSQSVPAFMRNWLLPHFVYDIGIFLIAAGIVIRCTAVLTLKRAFTFSVQTTSDQHLITTGLYHTVRNPAYTGSITSLLGVAFAYRHILGIMFVLILCPICYGVRICVEEKALKKQFQKEFEQYCVTTRYRLIPGIY